MEKASEFYLLKFLFIIFFTVGPCLSVNIAVYACQFKIPYIGFSESFKRKLEKRTTIHCAERPSAFLLDTFLLQSPFVLL